MTLKDLGKATLTFEDKSYDFKVVEGTEGEKGIDIRTFRKESGMITVDPGYVNTGACVSDITFINGEEGILRHRGYAIADLAENCLFMEVCNLLIDGALPNQGGLDAALAEVAGEYALPEGMKELITAFPRDAHPMSVLAAMTMALSSFYPEIQDSEADIERATLILLSKLPTIAAYSYRHSIGKDLIEPDPGLPYCANFMYMMFGDASEDSIRDIKVRALNRLLILHADHEQNCSTSTVRFIGSSGANLFASISGGIGALWGPLHGGANQAVLEMLEKIKADGISMDTFIDKVKNDPDTRLMGFGHRVYKAYDPRATIAKASCGEVLDNLGVEDPLMGLAQELEKHALEDEYFVKRNLYPNVDYYTGITYRGMGIPANMFTVLFAIGRLPGWIAHWVELKKDKDNRIARPRQIYIGSNERDFNPIAGR